ncbi:myosin-2 heavy chain-like [Colossoma macropomum]|uniref:myosin-2 heavy chain-like n=1 Tax=Colossoma macropomum TaxID=42526 RepID=UPI0018642324|nr:myosin-2 heavy chain-like [Colossoma macropomum]
MLLCCFFRPRIVDDEPSEEQQLKKGKRVKKEKKKKRGMKRGKLEEQSEKQVEVKQTKAEKEEEEKKEVEEVAVTEELKDEETSLKKEQVEEPVPADPLGFRDESSGDAAIDIELVRKWIEELLMDIMTGFTDHDDIMDEQKSLDADCSSSVGAPVEDKEMTEVEEVAVTEVTVEKKQEVTEREKDGVEKELLLEEISMERVEEVKMDLERVTEELKDEETSLKEEQVEEPVPADPLGIRDESSDDSASESELQTTAWCKDLLLNTILANAVSKLEDNEAKASSTDFKSSGDAQHQNYELLLMTMKKKWAGKFSETSAVRRPLVHPLTSCLHTDAPVVLHLHLNSTVDFTLKDELKQMDLKRKWMERLRQREELKKLSGSTVIMPTDVSDAEKSVFKTTAACKASEEEIQETTVWCKDLLLNTILANSLSKLEDKEASTHFKSSGDAQHQNYELLLMTMKKKWAGKFSETSAVRRPLVHPLTSCLHTDAPVVLHLHLNSTVDFTLKDELKQMDLKRKWMERLRQREELKKLSGSTVIMPTDVSDAEKSVFKTTAACKASEEEIQETTVWCKDLLLNTILANSLSKLEDKEASTHFKSSGDAQHQNYELLLMTMKKKWAGKFSETSAVRRPLVHPLTSCLHTDAKVDLHLHLNPTVDSTLKEEVKQVGMKRTWRERLRQREELKKLSSSSDKRPTDVSDTEKSANAVRKLEDKEAKAISTYFKNSGDAQHQDYELLLMKMKRKWAGKFSEMSAVRRPLVHPLTSCLHTDAKVDLHLHLNPTVDSTLKEEVKQVGMKRTWRERLRQREELKKLSSSSDKRPTDVSDTEKSAYKTTAACKASEEEIQETTVWCKDLLLNNIVSNAVRKLGDSEAKAMSTHFKNSGDAQHQDYELLLMKLKRKWARRFSEMSVQSQPLHPPRTNPLNVHSPAKTQEQTSNKKNLIKTSTCSQEEAHAMKIQRKWSKRLTKM